MFPFLSFAKLTLGYNWPATSIKIFSQLVNYPIIKEQVRPIWVQMESSRIVA